MTTTRHAPTANSAANPAPRAVMPAVLTAVLVLCGAALVTWPARAPLFASIAGGTVDGRWAGLAGLVADKGLLVLVLIAAVLVPFTWLRDRPRFWLFAAAGFGTVGAYGTSEVVKLLATEERPCRVVDVATVLACPVPGDWSWPSNHSTIAGALAVAVLLVAPRLWPVVAPLALVIAGARVAAGVHYVHDVASGLALGILVTSVVALALHAAGRRLTRRSTARPSPAARRTTGR